MTSAGRDAVSPARSRRRGSVTVAGEIRRAVSQTTRCERRRRSVASILATAIAHPPRTAGNTPPPPRRGCRGVAEVVHSLDPDTTAAAAMTG